jgi:hypothetical protein
MIQFHQTGIPARYCLLLFAALGLAMHTGTLPAVGTSSALGLELAGAKGLVIFRSEIYRVQYYF